MSKLVSPTIASSTINAPLPISREEALGHSILLDSVAHGIMVKIRDKQLISQVELDELRQHLDALEEGWARLR